MNQPGPSRLEVLNFFASDEPEAHQELANSQSVSEVLGHQLISDAELAARSCAYQARRNASHDRFAQADLIDPELWADQARDHVRSGGVVLAILVSTSR